jgi:spore germination protein KA
MLGFLRRQRRLWRAHREAASPRPSGARETPLSGCLPADLAEVKRMFGVSTDLVFREFEAGTKKPLRAALIFVDGLVDKGTIEQVIRSLHDASQTGKDGGLLAGNARRLIERQIVNLGEVCRLETVEQVAEGVLTGDSVLLLDGSPGALRLGTKGFERRAVQEPDTEVVIRGPREGFTEVLCTNTALLRRKLQNPNLSLETLVLGRRTKTRVALVYLKGLANEGLVAEVRRRLGRIETDAVLESGYLEQFIEDAPFSPFATVGNSEKPDVVSAKLLEGRVAILTDGTPHVLTVPCLFVESFQNPEDYYSRPYYASLVRWFRYLAFTMTVLSPAVYVALVAFHQELLPTPLLITVAAGSEGVPFPAAMEALMMGVVFEILREAGVRMPRAVGQAVSIVGALVIGDAAVSAGLIGPAVVIVVALTAITSFVVPPQLDAAAILRLTLLILASVLGAFGLVIGLLGVLIHLASLRSFGAPFLSPFAPLNRRELLQDVLTRAPLWLLSRRPRVIGWRDPERQEFRLRPGPPGEEG